MKKKVKLLALFFSVVLVLFCGIDIFKNHQEKEEKYSYTAITVALTGNYPEIYRRFVERNSSPDRHRGHVVNDGYPEKNPGGPVCPVPYEDFVKGITDRGMDRFAANGPHITVDTTDFEKVRIERVIRLKNVPDGPFFNRQFCVGAPQNFRLKNDRQTGCRQRTISDQSGGI